MTTKNNDDINNVMTSCMLMTLMNNISFMMSQWFYKKPTDWFYSIALFHRDGCLTRWPRRCLRSFPVGNKQLSTQNYYPIYVFHVPHY